MRAFILAVLYTLPVDAAKLELEFAPGYIWSADADVSSAVLRARVGADLGWFAPSIALFGALFQDGPPLPTDGPAGARDTGLRAWGVTAQARFHTLGRHQLVGGAGIGWGQLEAAQAQTSGFVGVGFRGDPAPYVQAFAGYRAELGRVRLGLELTLDGFNHVRLIDEQCWPSCPTGTTMYLRGGALTLGLALP